MKYTLRMAAAFCTLGLFAAALIGAPPKEVATSKEPTCAFCNEKECQKECQKECKHCLETRLEISAAAADADPEINASSAVRPGSRFGGAGARMRHGHGGDSQHQIDHEDFFS